jgi:hypothetical protein
MAIYKRKKEIVNAIQFDGTERSCHEVIAFCPDAFWSPPKTVVIDNASGTVQVYKDDYVVKDSSGEFYVHSSDDFENLYKLIE